LTLKLRAPSQHTPLTALMAEAFASEMGGGDMFALRTEDILYIRQYTRPTLDPERLLRSKMRAASKTGSPSSTPDSPDRDSRSAAPASPSGHSTGARTKRPILH
jgi:hypothetical protein